MHRLVSVSAVLALLVGAGGSWAQQCLQETARWGYGPARVIAVDGDTAVFTSGIVLMVGDVADPANPVLLRELQQPGIGDAIVAAGRLAFGTNGSPQDGARVTLLDLTDPLHPVQVAQVIEPGGIFGIPAARLAVTGTTVFTARGLAGLGVLDANACIRLRPRVPSGRVGGPPTP